MAKRNLLILLFALLISGLLSACQAGEQASSPEAVTEAVYSALADEDWETVCSYASVNSQELITEQVNSIKSYSKKELKSTDIPSIGKDPTCEQGLQWLNEATQKLYGEGLNDSIPAVVPGSERITGNKATVKTEYTIQGSQQKNEDTVQLIKEEGQWKLDE
jgi:hypothetical protein